MQNFNTFIILNMHFGADNTQFFSIVKTFFGIKLNYLIFKYK